MNAEFERAAREGDADAIDRLLVAGCDINARDAHGQTALMLAAAFGREAVAALLVERGAWLDHTAKYRLSALMLAVINEHLAIVRTLVNAGADRSIRGSGAPGFSGRTALDLALAAGRQDLANLLRAADDA